MSGGGMSFYLRMCDFSLNTLLIPTSGINVNEDGRPMQRGGRINDDGGLEPVFTVDSEVMVNVSLFFYALSLACFILL